MENKKRKSILSKQCADEDTTDVLRPKRRVSFRMKKSVREFNVEGWNESYELSDRVDTSNSASKSQLGSVLCTTKEFIDRSNQKSFVIEDTLEISLLDDEKHLVTKQRTDKLEAQTHNEIQVNKDILKIAEEENCRKPDDNLARNDGKYIFFNENSNKENISPHSELIIACPEAKAFNESLKGFSLLSNSDDNIEIKSFREDMQQILVNSENQKVLTNKNAQSGQEISITGDALSTTEKIFDNTKSTKTIYDESISTDSPEISGVFKMSESPILKQTLSSFEASPIFPSEFISKCKKLDMHQLNEYMASGKIQIFSKTAKDTESSSSLVTPMNYNKNKNEQRMNNEKENVAMETDLRLSKPRQTIFFNESIQHENIKQNKGIAFKSHLERTDCKTLKFDSISENMNCTNTKHENVNTKALQEITKMECSINHAVETIITSDTIHDDHGASLMDLTNLNFVKDELPRQTQRRQTHFFDDSGSLELSTNVGNASVNTDNYKELGAKPKLSFLYKNCNLKNETNEIVHDLTVNENEGSHIETQKMDSEKENLISTHKITVQHNKSSHLLEEKKDEDILMSPKLDSDERKTFVSNGASNRLTQYFENTPLIVETNNVDSSNKILAVSALAMEDEQSMDLTNELVTGANFGNLIVNECVFPNKSLQRQNAIFEEHKMEETFEPIIEEIFKPPAEFLEGVVDYQKNVDSNTVTQYFENSDLMIENNEVAEASKVIVENKNAARLSGLDSKSQSMDMTNILRRADLKDVLKNEKSFPENQTTFFDNTLVDKTQELLNFSEQTAPNVQQVLSKYLTKIDEMEINNFVKNNDVAVRRTQYFEGYSLVDETDQNDVQSNILKQPINSLPKLYSIGGIDLSVIEEQPAADIFPARKTLNFDSGEQMNISFQESPMAKSPIAEIKHRNRYTQHFDENNELDITKEKSLTQPSVSMSAKKLFSESKLKSKRKSVMFSNCVKKIDIPATPLFSRTRRSRLCAFSPATPHRSLIEFEMLEQREKLKEDDSLSDDNTVHDPQQEMDNSARSYQNNKKRDMTNLTPNLPDSKKLQSCERNNRKLHFSRMLFRDSNINTNTTENTNLEFLNNTNNEKNEEEMIDRTEPPSCFEEIIDNEVIENVGSNSLLTSSSVFLKPTTPSRIPVYTPLSKNKKNLTRISSPNTESLLRLSVGPLRCVPTTDDFIYSENSLKENQRESAFENEDIPITISDVSEHFMSIKQKRITNGDDSKYQYKNERSFVEDLLEISKNNGVHTAMKLVDQLYSDDEKEDEIQVLEEETSTVQEDCQKLQEIELPNNYASNKDEQKVEFCRKCKRCQISFFNETVSTDATDSFAMPQPLPLSAFRLTSLEKGRKGPNLKTMLELLQQIDLDDPIENFNDTLEPDLSEDELDVAIKEFEEESKRLKEELEEKKKNPQFYLISFVERLKYLMDQPSASNWIMNLGFQLRHIIKFRYDKIMTFCIILQYEELSSFGQKVRIKSIKFHESSVPKYTWQVFNYISHFQLALELPFDLLSLCAGNDEVDVFNMLQKIDEICTKVDHMAKELWIIAFDNDSQLIRENNQNLVRKVVRNIVKVDGWYHHTEKREFQIEITNIKKLSYKNIIMPPLYQFHEDIQSLPTGLQFLRVFLKNPSIFLRHQNESC